MSPVEYLQSTRESLAGRICPRCLLFWALLGAAVAVGIWAWRANHE